MDKSSHSNEEIYSLPCTTTISPISIPAVLPIHRLNYDISFHHNTTYATSPPFAQPLYGTQTASFPVQEIYPANPQNVVLTNGNPFFPPHHEFNTLNPQNIEVVKRPNWDTVSRTLNFVSPHSMREHKCLII